MFDTEFTKLETISSKRLNALEHHVRELLNAMKKSGLSGDPAVAPLRELEQRLGRIRRNRFDIANPEYKGF